MSKIIKYIPLFYVILIFLGYWNLHLFYTNFDIPIYNFVSTNEILTSFLPIILIIFIITLIMFTFLTILSYSDKDAVKADDSIIALIKYLKNTLKDETRALRKRIFLIGAILLSIFIRTIFFIYLAYNAFKIFKAVLEKDEFIFESYGQVVFLILLIIGNGLPWIEKFIFAGMQALGGKAISNFSTLLLLRTFIIYMVINSFTNYSNAIKIINGKPEYNVEFKLDNRTIKTNKSIVYIGMTQEYIFLRNIIENKNYIYNKKMISGLETGRIHYDTDVNSAQNSNLDTDQKEEPD